jgi:nickel transport protein
MGKILFLAALSLFISVGTALAHKVIVFAWVEQEIIHVEGSFGSSRPAKNCVINAKNPMGILIHQGITDEKGLYSFQLPDNLNSDLVVELDAGSGHSGRWTILKDELVSPSTPENLEKKMAQKQSLKKKPSLAKIALGIAIIFGLAFAATLLQRRKKGGQNA